MNLNQVVIDFEWVSYNDDYMILGDYMKDGVAHRCENFSTIRASDDEKGAREAQ